MTPFSVHTTPRYERLSRKLLKGHSELRVLQDRVRDLLQAQSPAIAPFIYTLF